MKINWKVRFKNPIFYVQIILAIFTPILTYMGLKGSDLTTWNILWDTICSAISNPYVIWLIVGSLWNAINDPTTAGLSDSSRAITYKTPSK